MSVVHQNDNNNIISPMSVLNKNERKFSEDAAGCNNFRSSMLLSDIPEQPFRESVETLLTMVPAKHYRIDRCASWVCSEFEGVLLSSQCSTMSMRDDNDNDDDLSSLSSAASCAELRLQNNHNDTIDNNNIHEFGDAPDNNHNDTTTISLKQEEDEEALESNHDITDAPASQKDQNISSPPSSTQKKQEEEEKALELEDLSGPVKDYRYGRTVTKASDDLDSKPVREKIPTSDKIKNIARLFTGRSKVEPSQDQVRHIAVEAPPPAAKKTEQEEAEEIIKMDDDDEEIIVIIKENSFHRPVGAAAAGDEDEDKEDGDDVSTTPDRDQDSVVVNFETSDGGCSSSAVSEEVEEAASEEFLDEPLVGAVDFESVSHGRDDVEDDDDDDDAVSPPDEFQPAAEELLTVIVEHPSELSEQKEEEEETTLNAPAEEESSSAAVVAEQQPPRPSTQRPSSQLSESRRALLHKKYQHDVVKEWSMRSMSRGAILPNGSSVASVTNRSETSPAARRDRRPTYTKNDATQMRKVTDKWLFLRKVAAPFRSSGSRNNNDADTNNNGNNISASSSPQPSAARSASRIQFVKEKK